MICSCQSSPSVAAPFCTRINVLEIKCLVPVQYEHALIESKVHDTSIIGTTLLYTCLDGYSFGEDTSSSKPVTCGADGGWTTLLSQCKGNQLNRKGLE